MKNAGNLLIAVLIAGSILSSCNEVEHPSLIKMISDKSTQDEVMKTICNDHEMMGNMMQHMMGNEHSMKMMQENHTMMQRMMDDMETMQGVMNDSSMCSMMMGGMMENMEMDPAFCKNMCSMMQNNDHMNGMMSGKYCLIHADVKDGNESN